MLEKIFILLINLIAKTWRLNILGVLPKNNAIIIFWHGKMLPGWYLFRKTNSVGVVSLSKDGGVLSKLLTKWNFELIRGSSSKESKEVLNQITEKAKNRIVLITPDGPRGTIYEVKKGCIIASYKSNTPIYCFKINVKNKFIFNKSWDKFEFPLPFTKIDINISEPISINAENEIINLKYYQEILKNKLI